jgi:monoamine oxidase
LTRRRLLELVGGAGGSAAVFQVALALGLTPGRAAAAPAPVVPLAGRKRSVVLLGGGLSCLMACLELERAGYECTILEASHRVGGRNLTLRSGDLVDELGYRRRCTFDDEPHLYFNAGPARIPAHHHYLLHYCRSLGVELEPFTNVNYNAWVQDPGAFGGERIRYRHFIADARGFLAELTAKASAGGAFDGRFDDQDGERLLEFLRAFGDLRPDDVYRGSARAGHLQPGVLAPTAGMLEEGTLKPRLDFREILRSDFWRFKMHFGELEDQAAPLLQARGGMDRIVDAFVRNIRSPLVTGAQVQRIAVAEDGVEVLYQREGRVQCLRADYCLNSIPSQLLLGLGHNFPRRYREGLAAIERGRLFKLGIQMNTRFWEAEGIYGGISWTAQPMEQAWYPSHGAHRANGVMLGAYTWEPAHADYFAKLSPAARREAVLDQLEALHPDVRAHAGASVSVPWHRMNHHLGCGSVWSEEARRTHFAYLQKPLRGRHFLVGDQMSLHPGWQEGALSSAHHALQQLQALVT